MFKEHLRGKRHGPYGDPIGMTGRGKRESGYRAKRQWDHNNSLGGK